MKIYDELVSAKVGKTFVESCGIGTLEVTKLTDSHCLIRVFFCLAGFKESLKCTVSTTNTCTLMEAASILNESTVYYGIQIC